MLDTEKIGKAYWGRKLVLLKAIAGYRISEDLKQYITVFVSIFVNPKTKSCRYLYSRIK